MEYSINLAVRGSKGTIHLRRKYSKAIKGYVDNTLRTHQLVTCDRVAGEVGSKAWDAITNAVHKAKLYDHIPTRNLINQVLKNSQNLMRKGSTVPDDTSELASVDSLYASIWADSTNAPKLSTWSRIKNRPVSSGPPTGADRVILSTAAAMAKDSDVEFLTFDHDFTIFRDEIFSSLHVTVVDGFGLS